MKTRMTFVLLAASLLTAGSMMLAAPGQDYTGRPGDPTQAKVWIQNTPLAVELSGTPAVTLSGSTIVQARLVRQTWEYRVVTVPQSEAAGAAMAGVGADGWETTGVQWPGPSGASLLLKRPR